jgi:hypothetical protein
MDDNEDGRPRGLPLALDPNAESASDTEPAFIAKPAGAPAYYGFLILKDVVVEGFTFVAPDNSRAGIVWEVASKSHLTQIRSFEKNRWGVYEVAFTHPMRNREDARINLQWLVPFLRPKWQEWKDTFSPS